MNMIEGLLQSLSLSPSWFPFHKCHFSIPARVLASEALGFCLSLPPSLFKSLPAPKPTLPSSGSCSSLDLASATSSLNHRVPLQVSSRFDFQISEKLSIDGSCNLTMLTTGISFLATYCRTFQSSCTAPSRLLYRAVCCSHCLSDLTINVHRVNKQVE